MTKELQNTKKLTEDTKEEHEKSKTVTDILEEIKQEMCDEYCKYPTLKTADVKVRVSVEREELDKFIKDMDRVNRLADETYDKIRKLSKIKIEC